MILKSLRLENFLSHKNTEITFSNSGITAFIGENGAGKSSIIEGILFALFGKGTKGNISNLVQWGKKTASVELIFEKNNTEYKVSRQIKLTGKSHSTTSAIYKIINQVPTLYYQKNINKEIIKLTGITQRTFFNSILVKQGEIEGLINEKPTDRAKTFEDLLDMTIYQLVADYYGEKRKTLENKLEGIKVNLRDEEELLTQINNLKLEKEKLEAKIKELENNKESLQEQLNKLLKQQKEFLHTKEEQIKYQKDIEKLNQELTTLTQLITEIDEKLKYIENQEEKLKELNKYIVDLEEKKQKLTNLLKANTIKEKLKNLEEKISKYKNNSNQLEKLHNVYIQYIEKEKRLNEINKKLQELAKKEGQIQTLQEQYKNLKEVLKNTQKQALKIAQELIKEKRIYKTLELNPVIVSTFLTDADVIIQNYEEKKQEIYAQGVSLKKQIEELEKKKQNVENLVGTCPSCLRPFEEHQKEEILKELESQIEEKEKKRKALRKEYDEYREKINKEKRIKEKLKEFEKIFKEHQQADIQIKQIKAKEKAILMELEKNKNLKKEKDDILSFLDKNKHIYTKYLQIKSEIETTDIEKLKKQIKILKEDLEKIDIQENEEKLKAEIKLLEKKQEEFIKIKQLQNQKKELWEKLEIYNSRINTIKENIEILNDKLEDIEKIEKNLEEIQNQIETIQSKVDEVQQQILYETSSLSQIDTNLQNVNREYKLLKQTINTINKIKTDIQRYKKVENALGKNGIQKIIRENMLYKLPQIVNTIFANFGFEFQQIRFDENFDISLLVNTNETIDRYVPITAISGGQKVALSIALRIALSSFLSNKTQFLIFDEPTIHLDEQRRNELVNILIKLKELNIVRQLIIITHDRELEDTADQIYYVEKGQVKAIE